MRAVDLWDHLSNLGAVEIARSYSGCLRVLMAAGGAGLITAGTVFIKLTISHGSLHPLQSGALIALNFVLSFLLIQAFGFGLATKLSPILGVRLGRKWQSLISGLGRKLFREDLGIGILNFFVSFFLAFLSATLNWKKWESSP